MRLLTSLDLSARFKMVDILPLVEAAYFEEGSGRVQATPRAQLRAPETHTFFNSSPALLPGLGVTGVSTYTGGNKGLPFAQKVILLFSTENGRLLAVLEADWISWMRTGATSGVATKYLARADAQTVGIIGAGKQARSQLLAMTAVREIDRAYVFSPTTARREQFAAEMSARLGIPVQTLATAADVVAESDIICTATTSSTPVFEGNAVRPGTHINAIGQHYPDRREVDTTLLLRSRLVVDDAARALQEDGELLIPLAQGEWHEAQIDASLGEIVAGHKPGRVKDEITLFTSGGIASEVLAVAAGLYRRAAAEAIGLEIDWDQALFDTAKNDILQTKQVYG